MCTRNFVVFVVLSVAQNYIYIFITIALDDAVIFVAVHFSIQNVTSCHHGRTNSGANLCAILYLIVFTICHVDHVLP